LCPRGVLSFLSAIANHSIRHEALAVRHPAVSESRGQPFSLRSLRVFLLLPRCSQKVSHLFVSGPKACPFFGRVAVALIATVKVDAVFDQEADRLEVVVKGAFVQDTRWLVRAPVGIDVRAVREQECGDLELPVHARPGERNIKDPLHVGEVRAAVMIVGVSKDRLAGGVEPAFDASEVANASGVRQIIGKRPDARQQRGDMGFPVVEREPHGRRPGRRPTMQDRGVEIQQLGHERFATVECGMLKQCDLKIQAGRVEHLRLALQPPGKSR
jgi:hypothetical protein